MKNIIYDNELQSGQNPAIFIATGSLKEQPETAAHDLGAYLYDHVFNYGSGIVDLYVTEAEDGNVLATAPAATIEYGRRFVTNFKCRRDEYLHSDDCASGLIKKIIASLDKQEESK